MANDKPYQTTRYRHTAAQGALSRFETFSQRGESVGLREARLAETRAQAAYENIQAKKDESEKDFAARRNTARQHQEWAWADRALEEEKFKNAAADRLVKDLRRDISVPTAQREIHGFALTYGRDVGVYQRMKGKTFEQMKTESNWAREEAGYAAEKIRTHLEDPGFALGRAHDTATSEEVAANVEKLQGFALNRARALHKAGQAEAGMNFMRQTRQDPIGRQRALEKDQRFLQAETSRGQISTDVQSGKYSNSEVMEKLSASIQKRIDLSEQISSTEKSQVDLLDKLNKELEGAIHDSEEMKAVRKEQIRQGKNDPTSSDKWRSYGGALQSVGSGISSTANAVRYINIEAEQSRKSIGAGFANLVNQQYDDRMAAIGGDMSAYARIKSGMYGQSYRFGQAMRAAEQKTLGLEQIGTDVTNAGGVVAGGAGLASGGIGVGVAAQAGNVANIVGASAKLVSEDAKYQYNRDQNLSASATQLAAEQIYRERGTAVAKITGRQWQAAFDTRTALSVGARGLGGGMAAYQGAAGDAWNNAQDMANLGADAGMQQALYTSSISALGGRARNKSPNGVDPEYIYASKRAMQLQNAGTIQDAGQYSNMLEQVTSAGGGASDLDRVLTEAVAAGMDSSKNIAQMVSGVSSLSQKSAAMGVANVIGASSIIAGGAAAAMAAGTDKNLAVSAAAGAASLIEQSTTSTGLNYGNIGMLEASTKMGLRGGDRTALTAVSGITLQSIKKAIATGNMPLAHKIANTVNLGEAFFTDPGDISSSDMRIDPSTGQSILQRSAAEKVKQVLRNQGAAYLMTGANYKEAMARADAGMPQLYDKDFYNTSQILTGKSGRGLWGDLNNMSGSALQGEDAIRVAAKQIQSDVDQSIKFTGPANVAQARSRAAARGQYFEAEKGDSLERFNRWIDESTAATDISQPGFADEPGKAADERDLSGLDKSISNFAKVLNDFKEIRIVVDQDGRVTSTQGNQVAPPDGASSSMWSQAWDNLKTMNGLPEPNMSVVSPKK